MEASNMFTIHIPSKQRAKAFNRGFTLLELLIALLIGSIVIAVVGGLFLANSNTFRAVDDSSRLQENGRFALQTISRIVRQAGFVPADVVQNASVSNQNDAFPLGLRGRTSVALPVVAGTTFISGTDGTNSADHYSDTLTLAFRPAPTGGTSSGEIVDCSGTPRTAALLPGNIRPRDQTSAPIVNTFFVAPSPNAASGNSLWCSVSTDGGATAASVSELIAGVDSFQVLYGINSKILPTNAGTINTVHADTYAPATSLTANAFNAVLTVQVALVLRGAERSTLDAELTGNKLNLNLFGTAADGVTPLYSGDLGAVYLVQSADTRRTFKTITSTINLRNRGAT